MDVKIEGLDDLGREFRKDEKRLQRASYRTLKELAKKVKTDMKRVIAGTYSLPVARIAKGISVKWPSFSRPESIVSFTGKTPGLQHYKVRETRGKTALSIDRKSKGLVGRRTKRKGKGQGLTAEVKKGQRKAVDGAFLAVANNSTGVFRRETTDRYPLERLHGPSVMGMFNATGGPEKTKRIVWENADRIFTRELEKELRR